uniref:Uncharacterized protein n=1 Tax=Anguilla anguilla TaxID=7936 RepID=A0A0E9RTS0_ANGAN
MQIGTTRVTQGTGNCDLWVAVG